MDFGIDTIVYILLGIIFVVAQATRKKKQQSAGDPASQTGSDPDDKPPLKGFFEQFLGMDDDESYPDHPVHTEADSSVESQPLSSDYIDAEFVSKDAENKIGKEVKFYEETETGTENLNEKSPNQTGFDLRRAVIYAAILERKYF